MFILHELWRLSCRCKYHITCATFFTFKEPLYVTKTGESVQSFLMIVDSPVFILPLKR